MGRKSKEGSNQKTRGQRQQLQREERHRFRLTTGMGTGPPSPQVQPTLLQCGPRSGSSGTGRGSWLQGRSTSCLTHAQCLHDSLHPPAPPGLGSIMHLVHSGAKNSHV